MQNSASLILVQGLFTTGEAGEPGGAGDTRARRAKAFAEHGDALGVRD